MSKFSQQTLITLDGYELVEILFDGHVTYGTPPAEHVKVRALFEPCLDDNDPDDLPREQIVVIFYDKPADIIAGGMPGDVFTISAKIKSRLIQPNDPTAPPFDATDVVGYYAEVYGSRRHQQSQQRQQQQQPATRTTTATQRSGGSASGPGKQQQRGQGAGAQQQRTQPADTPETAETGGQRTRTTQETYRPTRR